MLFPLGFFAMWLVVFPLVGATFPLPGVGRSLGAGLESVPPGPPFLLCAPLVDPLSSVRVSVSVGVPSLCGVSCLWCCSVSSMVILYRSLAPPDILSPFLIRACRRLPEEVRVEYCPHPLEECL
eukprot:3611704-Pyramimonas_sp.AAC.1